MLGSVSCQQIVREVCSEGQKCTKSPGPSSQQEKTFRLTFVCSDYHLNCAASPPKAQGKDLHLHLCRQETGRQEGERQVVLLQPRGQSLRGEGTGPGVDATSPPQEPLPGRVEGEGHSDAWMVRPPPSHLPHSHRLRREDLEVQWLEQEA